MTEFLRVTILFVSIFGIAALMANSDRMKLKSYLRKRRALRSVEILLKHPKIANLSKNEIQVLNHLTYSIINY